jgi:hypothetical protein
MNPRTPFTAVAAAALLTGGASAAIAAEKAASSPSPSTTPKVLKLELRLAPDVGRNTAMVIFRTDRPIERKKTGSLLGAARVAAKTASLKTAGRRGASGRCYVAYIAGGSGRGKVTFKVGNRYPAKIYTDAVSGSALDRILTLRSPARGDDRGRTVGC